MLFRSRLGKHSGDGAAAGGSRIHSCSGEARRSHLSLKQNLSCHTQVMSGLSTETVPLQNE